MGEEPTEVEIDVKDLDGFFKKRREEQKPDEEILREVFELNPDADIKKLVEVTGLPSLTIGRIKGQVSIRRKRDSKASEKTVEEGEMDEADTRSYIAQHGREGLNKVKRAFLKKTLAIAPNMSPKIAEWILHKWDINPTIQNDPNAFYELLHNESGLKPNVAISLSKDVFKLEETYADILENQGERPIFISSGPGPSGQTSEQPFNYRRDSQGGGPFEVRGRGGGSEQGFLTMEGYLKMEREKDERRRAEQAEEKREQRDEKFKEEITGSLNAFREELHSKKPSDESVVEEIPIDAQGNPCAPESAVSVKKIYRGGGAPRSDPLDTYLKLRQADRLDKTGQLDAEGVRRIVQEVVGSKPPGPSPEITEVNKKIDGLSQQLVQRDKELSEREKQALRDQINDLKGDVRTLGDRVASGGVNSVEGMLSTVGGKLVDKSPLKEAGQIVKELLTPSGAVVSSPEKAPAVTQAAPGAASSVLEALRSKGLVTTIREKVVGLRQ